MTRKNQGALHIDARDARGGEIILKSRRNRAIFIGGLVLLGLVAILA